MKFAHMADCHLGGWQHSDLNSLNIQSFQKAISICIKEKAEFVLIAGDLFDSAYPSIDTLKETFREFRRLKESNISVFIIAGSHDYSMSGKTFLEVLEKSGFCKNVACFEEKSDKIILHPTIFQNIAIYGYPGKKSGLEIDEVERLKLQDSPGLFKILMLHTTLSSAVQNPKIKSVNDSLLPSVNYLALGHLHIAYSRNGKVYPGPIFPNNLPELEELQGGSFYMFNNGKIEKKEIKLKNLLVINHKTNDTLKTADELITLLEKESLRDKIIILKLSGIIEQGRTSDINFQKIASYAKEKGAYTLLKNTSKLQLSEPELQIDTIDTEDIELQIINKFKESNKSRFNHLIFSLIKAMQIEKNEDEKSSVFEERLLSETRKVISI